MSNQKCAHSYECGKLYSALEVMDRMAAEGDHFAKALARTFVFKLGLHGYEYGAKPHRCGATLRRDALRALTHEAIEILNELTLRGRKSRAAEPTFDEGQERVPAYGQATR